MLNFKKKKFKVLRNERFSSGRRCWQYWSIIGEKSSSGWLECYRNGSKSIFKRHPPEQGIKSIEIDPTNPPVSQMLSNLDKLSGFVNLVAIYKV